LLVWETSMPMKASFAREFAREGGLEI